MITFFIFLFYLFDIISHITNQNYKLIKEKENTDKTWYNTQISSPSLCVRITQSEVGCEIQVNKYPSSI